MGDVIFCGSCGSDHLESLLDMGVQPLAEGGVGEYPLELLKCDVCSLVQLSYIPDQANVFRPEHPYATGNTKVLRDHFNDLAESLRQPGVLTVVDIGANDGTLLSAFPDRYKRIAVEPTDQIDKAAGVIAYKKFFTRQLAARILEEHGPADIIIATNVLAHVPDVHDFLAGVKLLLADDGVFVTENHDLASVEAGQWDTVYHEHLRYYSVSSLSFLLDRHDLRVVSSEPISTHGGSFRMHVRKQQGNFSLDAEKSAENLRSALRDIIADGNVIYGVGATTRATPLIHYSRTADYITCVCEISGSDKINSFIPGTDIPIVDEAKLFSDQPEYALLLSWHLTDSLIPKLRANGFKGKFIIPLPEVRIDG